MPDRDGIPVAVELSSVVPACVAVIVTGHARPGHLKRALEAGVRGFLPKTVSAGVLGEVVRAVHRGGRYVDPELAAEAIGAGHAR
jgi:two-component system response regulator DesR